MLRCLRVLQLLPVPMLGQPLQQHIPLAIGLHAGGHVRHAILHRPLLVPVVDVDQPTSQPRTGFLCSAVSAAAQ